VAHDRDELVLEPLHSLVLDELVSSGLVVLEYGVDPRPQLRVEVPQDGVGLEHAAPRHLEGGQALREELRRPLGDAAALSRREHLQQSVTRAS
jgi:hypothetical protein